MAFVGSGPDGEPHSSQVRLGLLSNPPSRTPFAGKVTSLPRGPKRQQGAALLQGDLKGEEMGARKLLPTLLQH